MELEWRVVMRNARESDSGIREIKEMVLGKERKNIW